jgi:hypothetical protein
MKTQINANMFQHWQPFALFQTVAICRKICRNENKECVKKGKLGEQALKKFPHTISSL